MPHRIRLALTVCVLGLFVAGCAGYAPTAVPDAIPTTPSVVPAATPTVPSTPTAIPTTAPTARTNSTYYPTQGWRTSTPEEQGMDGQMLARMLDAVKQQHLDLHSLLVIRNGYIVGETYYSPFTQASKHEIFSCTKSFIATLVGIAIDKGYIAGVNSRITDFFPGRTFLYADERKRAMTLDDLLTMRAGLEWTEGNTAYAQMYYQRDWVQFMLDKPMRAAPGTRFDYCTGCSHILSAIVQQQTAVNTRAFGDQVLFGPLGITDYNWMTDPSGIPIGGYGLQLMPRDMAKLGYLYLHNGEWDGKQIVSAQWVRDATRSHTATDGALGYGYQWWTYPSFGAYAALGMDGQTIFVLPDAQLIVVTTAALSDHTPIFQLIEQYIVPAVKK